MDLSQYLAGVNLNLKIVVRNDTRVRLSSRCFRGISCKVASNFKKWWDVESLLNDSFIKEELRRKVLNHSVDGEGTYSITITYPEIVGWSGTDDIEKYSPDSYAEYHPNRKSTVMRIIPKRTDILAPVTHKVTFVYELKHEDGELVMVIHSIYPGEDIGPLEGNITALRDLVMFDWYHPGE